jgi:hypothetical protein
MDPTTAQSEGSPDDISKQGGIVEEDHSGAEVDKAAEKGMLTK